MTCCCDVILMSHLLSMFAACSASSGFSRMSPPISTTYAETASKSHPIRKNESPDQICTDHVCSDGLTVSAAIIRSACS